MITETGLVATYDFSKWNGGKLVNIASSNIANGYNPSQYSITKQSGWFQTENGLTFSSSGSILDTNYTIGVSNFSIIGRLKINNDLSSSIVLFGSVASGTAFWIMATTNDTITVRLYDLTTVVDATAPNNQGLKYKFINLAVSIDRKSFIKIYINGNLIYTYTTLTAQNSINYKIGIGARGTVDEANKVEYTNAKIYNRILSDKEIKDYHNSFISTPKINEDFSNYTVGSISAFGSWIKKSGAFKISYKESDDPVLTHLKQGTRYLECTTAGVIGLKSNIAYGTWEFDWLKGSDANTLYFSFINTLNNYVTYPASYGYLIGMGLTESINFYRQTPSLTGGFYTVNSYVNINTWYSIKINRTIIGVFTIWIKGGIFKNWTLISTAGGSGTNPITDNTYTTSQYIVLDIDIGDCIANLKIYDGIIL
jgi:hypothetical protein